MRHRPASTRRIYWRRATTEPSSPTARARCSGARPRGGAGISSRCAATISGGFRRRSALSPALPADARTCLPRVHLSEAKPRRERQDRTPTAFRTAPRGSTCWAWCAKKPAAAPPPSRTSRRRCPSTRSCGAPARSSAGWARRARRATPRRASSAAAATAARTRGTPPSASWGGTSRRGRARRRTRGAFRSERNRKMPSRRRRSERRPFLTEETRTPPRRVRSGRSARARWCRTRRRHRTRRRTARRPRRPPVRRATCVWTNRTRQR